MHHALVRVFTLHVGAVGAVAMCLMTQTTQTHFAVTAKIHTSASGVVETVLPFTWEWK